MAGMRKNTALKIEKFKADYVNKAGLNHYQYIDTKMYPSWSTLKKYGIIAKTETIIWSHGEGEEEEVNLYEVVK